MTLDFNQIQREINIENKRIQNVYYFSNVEERAKSNMELVKSGKVRDHKFRDHASRHTGEIEEKECSLYCDLFRTKNCDFIFALRGSDNEI